MMRPDRATVLFRKAAQDELVLERLLTDADVDDDTLGFHAQQAAEKRLKALLLSRAEIALRKRRTPLADEWHATFIPHDARHASP